MRKNMFGDHYLHSVEELGDFLEARDIQSDTIHAGDIDPPDEGIDKFTCEVRDNETGDAVCYVEAETEEEVVTILDKHGIER